MPERYRLFVSALALLFVTSICPAQAIGWLNCAWPYRSTVTIFNPVGTTVSAYKKDVVLSGSKFDFTETQANAFAPAASYAVKAAISGTSHSSWINESPVISASDAIYLARTLGLMARGNTISWVTYFPLREDTVASLTLNPSRVMGGTSSQGTVTLRRTAGPGGIAVALTSSNPAAAQVPNSVTVAANATSATFTITTTAVSSGTSSTISASYNGSTQTASLAVTRPLPTVASLALNPSSVVGGTSSQGTVTLSGAAPAGGIAVTLTSSNPAAAQVAASVTVAANATSAKFTITTTAVSSATSSTISASYNGSTQTASLVVTRPIPTVASLALNPSSVVGGNNSQGTVTLTGPAPSGGAAVTLTSSNPAAAQVAASVTVAANATSATFTISTTAVSSATSSTISASYNGSTQTASLAVTQPAPTVASLSLNPGSVVGGSNSRGTVTLTGAALGGGATVTLTSSNPAAAQVPASVTVAANATSATFTISTTAVSSATSSTISATYNTTQTAVLGVGPSTLGWLDPAWLYRSAVTISNPGGTTLSAYQVLVVLSGSNFDFTKPQSSGDDIRFTGSDGVTLLPYWIESWNAGTSSASLWVQVPSVPSSGTTIYMYYGNASAVSASNGNTTFNFFDNFSSGSIDSTKWTTSGGTWSVVTGTEPNGLSGSIAQGSTIRPPNEILYSSTFTGGDYILEAYGLQQSGREWGLGTRVNGPSNLYSTNLYADLNASNNLYEYKWVNNNGYNLAVQLGSVAVGAINLNTWYKLRVAVHGTSLDVYLNDALKMTGSDTQFTSGGVALFGGENMVASFAYVRVRQFAATEPTAAVSAGVTNGLVVISLAVNPSSVVGGTNSQGTVMLSGPAPSGGAAITLTTSNPAAAQVPASVTVAANATSAMFTITTTAVSSATSSTISASYNGSTQTASLTIAQAAPTVASLTLNPTNVVGGGSSQGTVTLTGPALSGGATVTLASTNAAAAQVPTNVVILAATASATFTITTTAVSSATSSTISASYHGSTQTASLAVTQASLTSGVLTYHNDNLRTGQNVNETILTPANVTSTKFGKLFALPVDGQVFAQPLYMPAVMVGSQVHDLVFVATQHDSVYAWDADTFSSTPVWQTSFINPTAGVTTVPCADAASGRGDCTTITPEFGITGTPVIDSSTGTLYVVAHTKEVVGATTNYVYRLHALSITTGTEKFGGPVVLQASVSGTSGTINFVPIQHMQRPGLLLVNGVVYIGFGSHGDTSPWYGWLLGYNASTLQQVMVFNTARNGQGGAIWQSGCAPAADTNGNIYVITGNGAFTANSGGVDYGDSILKMNTNGTVADYFTPTDQMTLDNSDDDLGSGGHIVVPDQTGTFPHLLIGAGKQGVIYVINRDNMGKFNSSGDQSVQSLAALTSGPSSGGLFGSPAFWNNFVYFVAWNDNLKAFQLNSNGTLTLSSTGPIILAFPGATPTVSASGSSNGIVWIIQANVANDTVLNTVPSAVLRAYDATNVAVELYDSNQAANNRDTAGGAVKFAVPTVANGKVYIGNRNQLTVYGLLP